MIGRLVALGTCVALSTTAAPYHDGVALVQQTYTRVIGADERPVADEEESCPEEQTQRELAKLRVPHDVSRRMRLEEEWYEQYEALLKADPDAPPPPAQTSSNTGGRSLHQSVGQSKRQWWATDTPRNTYYNFGEEQRQAVNGAWHTKKEFEKYYGRLDEWEAAPRQVSDEDQDVEAEFDTGKQYASFADNGWNKTIYFIRAAEHQCTPDGMLSEKGEAQCEELKERWEATIPKVDMVFVSPSVRSMQTAMRIFPEDKIRIDPYLMEYRDSVIRGMGRYVLENHTQLLEDYLNMWDGMTGEDADGYVGSSFRSDPDRIMNEYVPPIERWNHFVQKVIRRRKATSIAIVSHRKYLGVILGHQTSNDFHRGHMKVRGLRWGANYSFNLVPVHEDDWWNRMQRPLDDFN